MLAWSETGSCEQQDDDLDGTFNPRDLRRYEPEDPDGYLDEDGCPDRDNDKDNLVDEADVCSNEPEVVNGYLDVDWCPDSRTRLRVRVASSDPAGLETGTLSVDHGTPVRFLGGEVLEFEVGPGGHGGRGGGHRAPRVWRGGRGRVGHGAAGRPCTPRARQPRGCRWYAWTRRASPSSAGRRRDRSLSR